MTPDILDIINCVADAKVPYGYMINYGSNKGGD